MTKIAFSVALIAALLAPLVPMSASAATVKMQGTQTYVRSDLTTVARVGSTITRVALPSYLLSIGGANVGRVTFTTNGAAMYQSPTMRAAVALPFQLKQVTRNAVQGGGGGCAQLAHIVGIAQQRVIGDSLGLISLVGLSFFVGAVTGGVSFMLASFTAVGLAGAAWNLNTDLGEHAAAQRAFADAAC